MMLLRWLVNNYLRDAAESKVRETIARLGQATPENHTLTAQQATEESRPDAAESEEPLPCEAVIVFALGIESGGLVDLLQGAEKSRHAHGVEHAGKLAGREVAIIDGGVGANAAARATAEAIKFYQPRWVISAGFAGALDENLRRGHIVMPSEIVSAGGERLDVSLKLDPQSLSKGVHLGRLLTVDTVVRREAERRRLGQEHAAVACDMESFGVADACHQRQVRFLAVRIISDALDDELPPEVEQLLKQKTLAGKLGAATGAILKRFSAAKDLWKLREDAVKASDRLAKFLVSVVQQLPTDHS